MTQGGFNIDDFQIYQNIFANNPGGQINADAPMTITNVNWHNNTFYNSGGVSVGNGSNSTNLIGSIWNNIIVGTGNVLTTRGTATPITLTTMIIMAPDKNGSITFMKVMRHIIIH